MVTGLSLIRSLYRNPLLRIFAYILMAAMVGGLGRIISGKPGRRNPKSQYTGGFVVGDPQ